MHQIPDFCATCNDSRIQGRPGNRSKGTDFYVIADNDTADLRNLDVFSLMLNVTVAFDAKNCSAVNYNSTTQGYILHNDDTRMQN